MEVLERHGPALSDGEVRSLLSERAEARGVLLRHHKSERRDHPMAELKWVAQKTEAYLADKPAAKQSAEAVIAFNAAIDAADPPINTLLPEERAAVLNMCPQTNELMQIVLEPFCLRQGEDVDGPELLARLVEIVRTTVLEPAGDGEGGEADEAGADVEGGAGGAAS